MRRKRIYKANLDDELEDEFDIDQAEDEVEEDVSCFYLLFTKKRERRQY